MNCKICGKEFYERKRSLIEFVCDKCYYKDLENIRSDLLSDEELKKFAVLKDKSKTPKKCCKCEKQPRLLSSLSLVEINGETYCSSCAQDYIQNAINIIVVTSTNNIDGYFVEKYIDIGSVEIVIGTGVLSEIKETFPIFLVLVQVILNINFKMRN